MESLSTDIWRYIFELACLDGGKTGVSLSRTSKAIRNVSAPVRFHSVELTRAKQVQKFLARLHDAIAATASERDPPRVRHLLLAFLPGKTDVCFLGPSFHFRDFDSWQGDKTGWNGRLVSALTQLLARIAPDLRTLTVLGHSEVLLPYVPCTLPALRELSLLQQDRMFLRASVEGDHWLPEPSDKEFYSAGPPPDLAALAAAPIFPALEKLHLVDGKWDRTLPLWSAAAPRLAHLKISGAEGASCQVLQELVVANPPSFGALRTIIISPAPHRDGTPSDIVGVDAVDAVREIVQSRPKLNASVVSGPKPNLRDLDNYWQTHLRQEWCKRAGGWWGTSVWTEDDGA